MKCRFELGLQVLDSYVSYILFSRNAPRLMSLADLPRSPHSGACAVLGIFCSQSAYCTFCMFESLDGLWVGGRGGGEDNSDIL